MRWVRIIISKLLKASLYLFVTCPAFGQQVYDQKPDTTFFELYNQTIEITNQGNVRSDVKFLLLCGEGSPNFVALAQSILKQGGSLTEVKFNTDIVTLKTTTGTYKFNAFNIFTFRGLYASLLTEGGFSDQSVLDSVAHLSREILRLYLSETDKPTVVTINILGKTYLEVPSQNRYFNPHSNKKNFIIVTEEHCYNYLKKNKINVVLQRKDTVDDGSLLAYSTQNNLPYVELNLEGDVTQALSELIFPVKQMIKELYPSSINH